MNSELSFKDTIKQLIYFFLNIISFFLPQKRAVILLYHSVDYNNLYLNVHPDLFEKQMAFLKTNGYNVISLNKLNDILREHGLGYFIPWLADKKPLEEVPDAFSSLDYLVSTVVRTAFGTERGLELALLENSPNDILSKLRESSIEVGEYQAKESER